MRFLIWQKRFTLEVEKRFVYIFLSETFTVLKEYTFWYDIYTKDSPPVLV